MDILTACKDQFFKEIEEDWKGSLINFFIGFILFFGIFSGIQYLDKELAYCEVTYINMPNSAVIKEGGFWDVMSELEEELDYRKEMNMTDPGYNVTCLPNWDKARERWGI